MCNKIIIQNDQPRNCKLKEFADGWCKIHHPDTLEEEFIKSIRYEELQMQKSENRIIGAWLRDKHQSIFEQMRYEIEKSLD